MMFARKKNGDLCSIEPPATISQGSSWKSKGTDSEYNLQIYVIYNFLFKSIWTYKAYANFLTIYILSDYLFPQ